VLPVLRENTNGRPMRARAEADVYSNDDETIPSITP